MELVKTLTREEMKDYFERYNLESSEWFTSYVEFMNLGCGVNETFEYWEEFVLDVHCYGIEKDSFGDGYWVVDEDEDYLLIHLEEI